MEKENEKIRESKKWICADMVFLAVGFLSCIRSSFLGKGIRLREYVVLQSVLSRRSIFLLWIFSNPHQLYPQKKIRTL